MDPAQLITFYAEMPCNHTAKMSETQTAAEWLGLEPYSKEWSNLQGIRDALQEVFEEWLFSEISCGWHEED